MWSLGDLYDEYGTMRAGSGTVLGIASATMRLHVKEIPAVKIRRLASIMGTMSEDEDEDEDERGPAAKAPRVTYPKVVIPAGDVSGGKGGAETEAPKDAPVSAGDWSVETVRTVGSGDTLAMGMSEEHPPEETFDERGKFL